MKKLILVILVVLGATSCTNDDLSNNFITTPNWAIGIYVSGKNKIEIKTNGIKDYDSLGYFRTYNEKNTYKNIVNDSVLELRSVVTDNFVIRFEKERNNDTVYVTKPKEYGKYTRNYETKTK